MAKTLIRIMLMMGATAFTIFDIAGWVTDTTYTAVMVALIFAWLISNEK